MGQIGDGTSSAPKAFIPISGLTGVAQIALGGDHSGARIGDGSMKCWGSNSSGGLGDGTLVSRSTPTPVTGIGTGVEVDAGGQGGLGGYPGFDAGTGGATAGADGSATGGAGGGDAGWDWGTAGAWGKDASSDAADAPAGDADGGDAGDADGVVVGDAGGATACNNIDITSAPSVMPRLVLSTSPPPPAGGTFSAGNYYLTSMDIYPLDNPAPTVGSMKEVMVVTRAGTQCTLQIALQPIASDVVQHFTQVGPIPTGSTMSGDRTCPAGAGSGSMGYTATATTLTTLVTDANATVTVALFTRQVALD
jgi:hypothetical protein